MTFDDMFGLVRAITGGIPWSKAFEVTSRAIELLSFAGQAATATDAGIIASGCTKNSG